MPTGTHAQTSDPATAPDAPERVRPLHLRFDAQRDVADEAVGAVGW